MRIAIALEILIPQSELFDRGIYRITIRLPIISGKRPFVALSAYLENPFDDAGRNKVWIIRAAKPIFIRNALSLSFSANLRVRKHISNTDCPTILEIIDFFWVLIRRNKRSSVWQIFNIKYW